MESDKTTSQIDNTKEATSPASHGTRKAICEKHGEYDAKVIAMPNMDHEHVMPCPKCMKEREEKEERRERDRERYLQQKKVERYLDECNIPKRFQTKTLQDLKAKTDKQREIFGVTENYLSAIKAGDNPSLIMCGKPGTGKTHIGCAFVVAVCENGVRGEYITTSRLMRMVKSTFRKEPDRTEEEIIQHYTKSVGFLVIDEVGVQFGTETEKLIFYEIINGRYENILPTVLISNLTAKELSVFIGERAFDRFKEDGGAILAFTWGSHRGE